VDSRGLETHSCPCTGLFMTSDVAGARPLSAGSGKGQRLKRTRGAWPDRAWTSHQTLTAARPVAHDRGGETRSKRPPTWRSERARSQRLDLGVWLVHARSGYAAMNFSSENTVSRDNM